MAGVKRLTASFAVLLAALVFGALALAQSAQAAPTTGPAAPACTVSNSNPSQGGTITSSCSGTGANHVTASIGGYDLGAFDASGSLSLPSGICGHQTLVLTGSNGAKTSVPLDITCAGTSGGGTNLGSGSAGTPANTGVAVASIGGAGVLLLLGGGLLLAMGRRGRRAA